MSDSAPRPALAPLIAIGTLSWLAYAAIAVLSRQFAMDVPSISRPHLVVWGLLALLFAGYLLALRLAIRCADDPALVRVILLFATAFRLLLFGTSPIQEIDLDRYIWDGNVTAAGISPYRYAPKQVIDAANPGLAADRLDALEDASNDDDALSRLVELTRRSSALARILRTIHFAELTTPYPPVSQAVFAAAAFTTPDAASIGTHLTVMKAWIVLFDLLTILAMAGLLRATGLAPGWLLAYAWCPLVLKEFANSGHLDAIAVCLTTAALWQFVVNRGRPTRQVIASLLLGLSVGAKLYPIILLPLCAAWLWRQDGPRAAVRSSVVVILVSAMVLWPMVGPRPTVSVGRQEVGPPRLPTGLVADNQSSHDEDTHSGMEISTAPSGLSAFLTRWRMNDLLFLIVNENLDPSRPQFRQPWFAVVPDSWRMTIVAPLMGRLDVSASAAAFLLTRLLTLSAFGLIVALLCRKLLHPAQEMTRQPEAAGQSRWLEFCFLTLAWFWLLAPTQNPWYWTWCLPLIPFARSRAWLWVSGLTLIYYLRFWLNAHWPSTPGPLGSRYDGATFFDFVVVWVEFVPLYAGLLASVFLRRCGKQ